MGKAYVGMLPDGYNTSFNIDLLKWKISCFNVFNSEDSWNGLTIKYEESWPSKLILSSQILEQYSNVFRLLFPIKTVHMRLNRSWIVISRETRKDSKQQIYFKLSILRNKMNFFVANIWSYFHIDVLEVHWTRLEQDLAKLEEFEDLRKALKRYLDQIFVQSFLKSPQITGKLFVLVEQCKMFCGIIERIEQGELVYDIAVETQSLQDSFDEQTAEFIRLLTHLNQTGSSAFLSQLLTRLNFNMYYDSISNEMDIEGF